MAPPPPPLPGAMEVCVPKMRLSMCPPEGKKMLFGVDALRTGGGGHGRGVAIGSALLPPRGLKVCLLSTIVHCPWITSHHTTRLMVTISTPPPPHTRKWSLRGVNCPPVRPHVHQQFTSPCPHTQLAIRKTMTVKLAWRIVLVGKIFD
ncbi:hypothetical protein niasHT_020316 [Heterodera trifolii]|uniref:Uncharacterized protein n=1 Tax=Heterodera trifolii TaxID=157864 RepID=A0ABD2K4L2_9BILA